MKLPEFGVEAWLNKWETKATYDISQSSIKALTLEELIGLDGTSVAEFFNNYAKQPLDYGAIEGSEEFKRLVAQLYQNIKPDSILQTNGATGGNLLALYALVEPGDEVVSMVPSYQQLYDIPKSFGAKVKFVHLQEKNGWQFNINELKELVTEKTKMITLNSANNPTGTWIKRKDLEEIVAIARLVDAYVLVDEVYEPLLQKEDFVSIADIYEKGIASNSMSKTYSLPGIRIGWTASSLEVADILRKYRDYTMICGGVLNDALAIQALKNRRQIILRNQQIIQNNIEIVKNWATTEPKVSLVLPQNVSTAFIKLEFEEEDYSFFTRLLKKTGVLLIPGAAFGFPKHARLGYCCDPETLRVGLKKLSSFLHEND
ncbi:aminotransferase [Ligilactobacillus sp. WILCCON 0076]|uniref:Aminotransferase n=1 Tax=Ligilactobacillus ubinensis TaxID=2876789 RepID=A0A9X2FG42_9LACO|nr:aminotransferase [Ligilactobacillus ubinensis]MCP0885844.1 aminotransferase [Ligilactobacillus ubinensis]